MQVVKEGSMQKKKQDTLRRKEFGSTVIIVLQITDSKLTLSKLGGWPRVIKHGRVQKEKTISCHAIAVWTFAYVASFGITISQSYDVQRHSLSHEAQHNHDAAMFNQDRQAVQLFLCFD